MASDASDAVAVTASNAALSVRVAAQDGGEVHFRIKMTTPMSKLFEAYCERQGTAREHVRFLFDGARIADENTAKTLEMEDGDCIDAVLAQTGG